MRVPIISIRLLIKLAIAPLIALLSVGCATTTISVQAPTPAQTQRVLELPDSIDPQRAELPLVDFLATTPAMTEFVKTYAPSNSPSRRRLVRLFEAIKYHPAISTEYDAGATLTAREVFETRRGNCLSFSAMFIALAREVGLRAFFQEVDVPPTWEQVTSDTVAQYRHVNIVVRFPGDNRVIDFRIDRYKETYPRRILTDEEALAHYYSNIGMEKLLRGDTEEAFLDMQRAIEIAPRQSHFWTNMGIIQRRLQRDDLAEISYRQALVLDGENFTAMGNLAFVYDEQHKNEQADRLRSMADQSRLKNPYYRYALAQKAYSTGDYDNALQLINYAVRRRSGEHKFHYLRSLSLHALGDSDAAMNSIKRAIRLTDTDYEESTIERYQDQLDEWMAQSG